MSEMRKITVKVPADLLASAQAYTGEGVTATIRTGLRQLVSLQAQRDALKLRGQVNFSMSVSELRRDRE